MPRIKVEAPAKLNLHLQIGDRRPDGFHDIESLFLALAFGDTLSFETIHKPQALEICMDWQIPGDFPPIPPEKNIISRAVSLFRSRTGYEEGLKITVEKRIPPGGGLGGGSSDAAAALLALNRLASEGKNPVSDAALAEMGASLGSDVPFFLWCQAPFSEKTSRRGAEAQRRKGAVTEPVEVTRKQCGVSGAAWVSGRGGKRCTPLRGVDEKMLHAPAPDRSSMTSKMRLALASRLRRGQSEVCNSHPQWLPCAWVSGRGEVIQPLELPEPARSLSVVLVNPGFSSDTAEAYRLFDAWRSKNSKNAPMPPQDSAFLTKLLSVPPESWSFSNDFLAVFEAAAGESPFMSEAFTVYRHIISGLRERGAGFAGLSGSGSTCFGVFCGREKAELARESLLLHWPLVICTFFTCVPCNTVI